MKVAFDKSGLHEWKVSLALCGDFRQTISVNHPLLDLDINAIARVEEVPRFEARAMSLVQIREVCCQGTTPGVDEGSASHGVRGDARPGAEAIAEESAVRVDRQAICA